VDAMFLLSRAEAKGMPLQREPLYLDDLTAECARACRVVADERGVDVRVTGDTEAALTGDAGLLRQMIGNLLDNAIRHAQAGGSVTAMVRRNGATCVLHVRDGGSGIEMADRERIFLRFVRLDPRSEGAGLGLPIARRIAEAHGGSLVLESSGPDGTSFKVTVPAS
jgi:signal transduction histidine kinase